MLKESLQIIGIVLVVQWWVTAELRAQTPSPSQSMVSFEIGQFQFREVGAVKLEGGEKAGRIKLGPDGHTMVVLTASPADKKKEQVVKQLELKVYDLPSLKMRFTEKQSVEGLFLDGRLVATLGNAIKGEQEMSSVSLSPDGKYLAIFEKGFKVRLLDAATGVTKSEIILTKKKPQSVRTAVDWDRHMIASQEEQDPNDRETKTIRIYDLFTARELTPLNPPERNNECGLFSNLATCGITTADPIESLYFLPQAGLLTATLFGKVYLWDIENGKVKRQLVNRGDADLTRDGKAVRRYLLDWQLSPQRNLLALCERDGFVSFWKTPQMDWLYETPQIFSAVASEVTFSNNGNLLLVRGREKSGKMQDRVLALWDIRNRRLIGKTLLYTADRHYVQNNYFLTPDEKYLIVQPYNKDLSPQEISAYSITDEGMRRVKAPSIPAFSKAAFSNDGSLLCLITEDQEKIVCYDVQVKIPSK